ncbi:MAG: hypothetical protein E7588_03980 [Ruminococcaceae bacterium]|nr:hypothetical protein [Oscillospiraceae bacterium]
MKKQAYFFIDDVIWVMRDLTRLRPKSMFDNPFMNTLKKAHDQYGLTVQLNLFYRTDFFYGNDEFTLSDMTDEYKSEFEKASDWLKMTFHAKQEFPDYPYINAEYDDVKQNCMQILDEIRRFAGEKSISRAIVPHWLPISKEGCRALKDCGLEFIYCSDGETTEFTGDDSVLPYGHGARIKQNRKPETRLYTRPGANISIRSSACAYNHLSTAQNDALIGKNNSLTDDYTAMKFRARGVGPCLNLYTLADIERILEERNGTSFISVGNHEQYFYSDYYAYQPDYSQKIMTMSHVLHKNGYEFITADSFM